MALSLYDPKKQVFRTWTPPSEGELPREEVLLLNILIELKVIAHFLQAAQVGSLGADEVNSIRADTVAV